MELRWDALPVKLCPDSRTLHSAKKQGPFYSCWSFGLSGQEADWQDFKLTNGISDMPLLVKCPSPLPNCFLSPKGSDRPLSFFQVLDSVCPLRSLSFGPHSRWDPKLETGDLGCWYVPNVGGIQQLSECPKIRHSCVHISVASTRPRGPNGPSESRKQNRKLFVKLFVVGSIIGVCEW